jgi:linoleoyl-CoA desaturase
MHQAQGLEDLTAMFESYHAFADLPHIRQMLAKYAYTGRVVEDQEELESKMMRGKPRAPLTFSFHPGGVYDEMRGAVRNYFLSKAGRSVGEAGSITDCIKATPLWYVKEALLVAVYIYLYLAMLGIVWVPWGRVLSGFCAGCLLMCISFCTLHDASHYGILYRRPMAQAVISRVSCAWALWNHVLWMKHHVYGHHSFTGDPTRDPDLIHARPFIRKHARSPTSEYVQTFLRWQHVIGPFFMILFPGQSIGQTISYFRGVRQGHLWRVPSGSLDVKWWEWMVYALSIGSHVYGVNLAASWCYFIGINFIVSSLDLGCCHPSSPHSLTLSLQFHINIAPDHDTYESAVLNHVGVDPDKPQDWGEVQVRHSGNYSTTSPLTTQMFGGINFQVEHHLFPSMSHMHYAAIAPIVRRICEKHGIPYVTQPTMWAAYKSYVKTLYHMSHTVCD